MQQIMTQCFLAVKTKLERRLGLFDLIGCDFMVDEDFKVGPTVQSPRSTRRPCPRADLVFMAS